MVFSLLLHEAAVVPVLVGEHHLVDVDTNGGQDAVQLLDSLPRKSGLSAEDPDQLHTEQAKVCAAVYQAGSDRHSPRKTPSMGFLHEVRPCDQ